MTVDKARHILIISSLVITGCQLIFLFIAPSFRYPLGYPDNLNLLEIISPVFLGYLGSATHFIFQPQQHDAPVQNRFLGTLVVGPLTIYSIAVVGAFTAFGLSNSAEATPGSGMSVSNLATALSVALGVLAVTTGVIVSYLFSSQSNARSSPG
jgi:hypothetical protein